MLEVAGDDTPGGHEDGHSVLLMRRHRYTGQLSSCRCWTVSPAPPPGSVPAQRTARQRRPTGAPPPHPVRVTTTTTTWLVLAVVIVACAFLFSAETPWLRVHDRANTWILRLVAQARTPHI
jgi:hypothetical protein